MTYTDDVQHGQIKSIHLSELAKTLEMLSNQKKVKIEPLTLMYEKITSVNIKYLQTAIHQLETNFSENCCQANCCQTCQRCQECQDCQICQGCQSCQADKKSCQSCQSCQQTSQCHNCDCDCGDDSS